ASDPTVYVATNSAYMLDWMPKVDPRFSTLFLPRVTDIVIRGRGDASALAGPARAVIRSIDPLLPVFDVASMEVVAAASTARTTFTAWMLAAGAAVALVLGVVGVYGVVAYSASMRTREIGLRLALGADPAVIRRMMVSQSMKTVAMGLAGGLLLTWAITGS